MPTSYEIDSDRRLVLSRAWGVLTTDDIRLSRAALQADAEFHADFGQLFDLRDVTDIAFSSATMWSIATNSLFAPGVRRAFVAATGLQFGMARMFAAHSEAQNQDVRAFRDLDAALAWLGATDQDDAQKASPEAGLL